MNRDVFESLLNKIIEESFDDWYNNEISSKLQIDFQQTVWWDFDEYDFDLEFNDYCLENELQNTEIEKEKYLDECIKDKAEEYYQEKVSNFLDSLSEWDFINDEKIRIFRALQIANEDFDNFLNCLKKNQQFKNYKGIGCYWAFCSKSADAHWAENLNKPSKKVLLSGIIELSKIDIKSTFLLNMDSSLGEDEKEIRLLEGDTIYLESLEGININSYYNI